MPDLAPVLAYARRAAMVLVVVLAGFWALPMLERAPGGSAERDGPSLPGSGPEPLVTVQASSEARDVETPLNPEELRLIEEKLTDGETQLVIAVHGLEAGSRVEQTSIAFDVQALQVRDQLLGLGVPEERFRFVDYGSRRPVCDEPTEVCRRANQRVEIIALQPGGRQPSMREASED